MLWRAQGTPIWLLSGTLPGPVPEVCGSGNNSGGITLDLVMSNETTTTDLVEVDAPTIFEIPAYRYDEFTKRVDKANRRLAKAGGSERFEFTFETFDRQIWKKTLFTPIDGTMEPTGVYEPYIRATLVNDSFLISAGDYTFVATLVAEEAGYTVHTAPGQSLDGWVRPDVDDIHCDVCKTVRRRLNIYIVRDNITGNLIQVGSNCIAPLLGFSPKSLWALTWTEDLFELEDENEGGSSYGAQAARTVDIDRVISLAWVYTNYGKSYVNVKIADLKEIPSTSSLVRGHIFNPPRPGSRRGDKEAFQAYLAKQAEAEVVAENETLITAIRETAISATQEGTDYGDNLRVILAADSGRVSSRNVGILASVVAIYSRELGLAAEKKANPIAKGWIGEEKERVRNFSVTLTTVKEFERDSFSGYGTETATMIIGRTADGHVVKWVYAGTVSYEVGDVINIKAGTVKKQDTWNDIDQTVLNRVVVSD